MTDYQQHFYQLLKNKIVDYDDLHEEFITNRIHKIDEKNLKFLLEDINIDKDNITNKKGYITYAKFIHYADKMINSKVDVIFNQYSDKVEKLYNKRELLLKTISSQNLSIEKENELISNLESRKLMFRDKGKNILDDIDYFIISKIGFNNFFNENKNHMIKENINKYLKEYGEIKLLKSKNKNFIGI